MTKDSYLKDLTEIRSIMEQSSRFLSLSGWSGILAGTYALIGAFLAHHIIHTSTTIVYKDLRDLNVSVGVVQLFLLAIGVFAAALLSGFVLSHRKAKQNGVKFWTPSAYKLLYSLMLPLGTGGVFVLVLYSKGIYALMAPACLIFYGLSLVNAGKYTYSDISYLGITEIILGLIACFYTGYGLYFWAFGFGIMHILYGIAMYVKYERKTTE